MPVHGIRPTRRYAGRCGNCRSNAIPGRWPNREGSVLGPKDGSELLNCGDEFPLAARAPARLPETACGWHRYAHEVQNSRARYGDRNPLRWRAPQFAIDRHALVLLSTRWAESARPVTSCPRALNWHTCGGLIRSRPTRRLSPRFLCAGPRRHSHLSCHRPRASARADRPGHRRACGWQSAAGAERGSARRDDPAGRGRHVRRHLHAPGEGRIQLHPDHHRQRGAAAGRSRIDPSYKPRLATIRSSTTIPALATAAGASYYRIVGVAFEANKNGSGDIIALGRSDQTTLSAVPHQHRARSRPDDGRSDGRSEACDLGQRHQRLDHQLRYPRHQGRGTGLAGDLPPGIPRDRSSSATTTSRRPARTSCSAAPRVSIAGVVPSDITVEDNFFTKNPSWRGTTWTVKNLFELKNARRVLVRHNIMQFNWSGAQAGYAIVLTPRNSNGTNPWVGRGHCRVQRQRACALR